MNGSNRKLRLMTLYDRFYIGSHFVGALINGDHTGLTDDDEAHLTKFWDEVFAATGAVFHTWDMPDDQTEFARCDVTRKWSNCVTLDLYC